MLTLTSSYWYWALGRVTVSLENVPKSEDMMNAFWILPIDVLSKISATYFTQTNSVEKYFSHSAIGNIFFSFA